jgi:hypothetical protein
LPKAQSSICWLYNSSLSISPAETPNRLKISAPSLSTGEPDWLKVHGLGSVLGTLLRREQSSGMGQEEKKELAGKDDIT